MKHPPSTQAFGPTINRIADVMGHIPRYTGRGTARLAADTGLNSETLKRILDGCRLPRFTSVARIASAFERQLGRPIDLRDLVAENGEFLTRYTCDLVGCPGCIPDNAVDEFGNIKSAFAGIEKGKWVTSRHPHGLAAEKGGAR